MGRGEEGMTESVIYRGRAFKDLVVGERFADAMTITEAHLVAAAGLFNSNSLSK